MKLSDIAKEILSQSYNVTDQAGEELHVVDTQDVMDILNRLASNGGLADVSLRDFFAGQAMNGILGSLNSEEAHKNFSKMAEQTLSESLKDAISRISYAIADSMLAKT